MDSQKHLTSILEYIEENADIDHFNETVKRFNNVLDYVPNESPLIKINVSCQRFPLYTMEEIADRGWAVANFYYQDVTSDNANVDGLLALLDDKDVGKITLWAWGAMRILDYLYTRDDIDLENVAVAGHSRLGKTALLCAAYDTRFRFCHSNCSGTCGAALFSEIEGGAQTIENIVTDLPYWFNDRFTVYKGMEQYDRLFRIESKSIK